MKKPKWFGLMFLLVAGMLFVVSGLGCAAAHLPTPTPRGLVVELADAEEKGLVEAEIHGRDLRWVNVVLESLLPDPLEVTIPIGTLFEAQSRGTQDMVVREERVVFLESAGATESVNVPAACANMSLHIPGEEDEFSLSRTPVPEDLIKLLSLPDFHEERPFVQQFAVWTITDNPARDEYRGLGYFGVGYPPDDEDIEAIRTLFEKAGIPTEDYQALR
jgi:hypothetical protein